MALAVTYSTLPSMSADHDHTRVTGRLLFNTGRDQRTLGLDQRHRLTLHVRTHQGSVGIVVLKERNERRSDRNNLNRADADIVDLIRSAFR